MPVKPPEELKEDEKTENVAPLEPKFDIKHVIRGISPVGVFNEELNVYPANVVEDYLRAKYLEDGYKLFFVQHLDTKVQEGNPIAEMMFYVFIKQ